MGNSYFLLGLAGAAGTWARVGLNQGLTSWTGWSFPAGTLVANVLGSFVFGCVWAAARDGGWMSEETRRVLCLGFLGAFTTFSTFAFDNGQAFRNGDWALLLSNLLLNNLLGIAAVLLGLRLFVHLGSIGT
ncbi:MAG: CrcB family protein [Planctomycetes bacterium]|nr:CrcB family protein [Planctomycetota bacterium]